MGRIPCVDLGVKSMSAQPHLLGAALTARMPGNDNLMFHKALHMLQPGDVLVIDTFGDFTHAKCGELMWEYAQKKGCVGIVVNGVIRDLDGLAAFDMPVFARGSQPNGPYKHGPGEVGVPVVIGGSVIHPGDIVVGDLDGLLAVRPHEAEALAQKARATFEMETRLLEQIRATGQWDRKAFADAIDASGVEIIHAPYLSF